MNFKSLLHKPLVKVLTNKYVIIICVFVVWMLFLDGNSYLIHREYNKEVEELETWIDFHEKKIAEDKKTIQSLEDSVAIERYAREKYLMKKKNEDIYIIEFDTIRK
ncbi:septum formation initiator family protein [Tenacibaculum sp. SG-28]|uniref:FtsB family cell division protein n=1 Tax=Tenacibaculum sp. SG-28 TaxID=754426 RepID=UPI000CF37BA5|nr:septum formation initiator family protein [Tenacibaculum sp. SG-28]PQJ21068.1 septum formation initiator [Tenacibaculum sp. SG-28]